MSRIDRALLRFLLPRLLARACGEDARRSDQTGERTNCFITTMTSGEQAPVVLLSIENFVVSGLQHDGHKFSVPKSFRLDEIDPNAIGVSHYLSLDAIRYQSVREAAVGLVTRWPYARIRLRRFGNALAQYAFNRRTLETRNRIEILRAVVEAVASGGSSVDSLDLMSRRYGDLWAGHPDWEAHQRQLEFHLELLAESGELTNARGHYRPTGVALKALEESEEQDRKHSANLRVQGLLVLLTLFSAMMAAAQAGLIKLPTVLNLSTSALPAGGPVPGLPVALAVKPGAPCSLPTSATASGVSLTGD